jgi:gentisate 1,2-dioxygenase
MSEAVMTDIEARQGLVSDLARLNLAVHQPDDPPLFTREPVSAMQPCHWRASDIAAWLATIGSNLKLEAGGNRRTLRLTNPGLAYGTTPTFWASIQYILPGEIATAHRHQASALRFIMQGTGAETIVDGVQYPMNEGDLVLTPSWTFHDHQHHGDAPMVWLDVLDISLVRSLEAVFFEPFPEARQEIRSVAQPGDPLVYEKAWAEAQLRAIAAHDADPFDNVLFEYTNRHSGAAALPTIGTALQMLRPGARTQAHRHTGSAVYYVVRGSGTTIVDGAPFDWDAGDFIALPPWAIHRHANRSGDREAVLFVVSDFPALKALGLWREEAVLP